MISRYDQQTSYTLPHCFHMLPHVIICLFLGLENTAADYKTMTVIEVMLLSGCMSGCVHGQAFGKLRCYCQRRWPSFLWAFQDLFISLQTQKLCSAQHFRQQSLHGGMPILPGVPCMSNLIVDCADRKLLLCCSAVCYAASLYGASTVKVHSQRVPSATSVGRALASCTYCYAVRLFSPHGSADPLIAVQEHHVRYQATGSS